MRKLLVLIILLGLTAIHIQSLTPAQAQSNRTITQTLRRSSTHNLFIQLATEVGLADDLALNSRTYTVFVPPNEALLTLVDNLERSDAQAFTETNLLKQILQYHILGGELSGADISQYFVPQSIFTFSNQALVIGFDRDNTRIILNNGASTVVDPNVLVSNGILHFVDNLLIPPGVEINVPPVPGSEAAQALIPAGSIPDVANRNGLTAFVRAITAAGLVEDVANIQNLTVFVPRNGAFNTLQSSTGLTPESAPAEVLTYHVSLKQFSSFDLANIATNSSGATLNGQAIGGGGGSLSGTIGTLNGAPLRIQLGSGTIVLNNGNALVTGPDIAASNGVIHVIDNVLLP